MKLFIGLIVESILFFVVLLAVIGNMDMIAVKNILNGQVYNVFYPYLTASLWVAGVINMGLIAFNISNLKESKKISAYKKEYEKNSVAYAEKDDIIKALENKVKTLETALDSVLKNKEQ